MKIGNIEFGPQPVFLAPMEDVTDIGFRLLCKRFGASMVYTEFVSAEALVRSIKSTVNKLTISDEERPVGIQIYGRDVDAMVEAARIVEQAGPDLIDLNFGCPVKKVAGKGAGAGMLQDIPKMLDITRRVVEAVRVPVTVKTRLGWNHEQLVITTLAEQLQDCGIKALTIHGRTRSQMYTGQADWTLIGEVKRNPRITIPIIGNGDITTPQQAADAFNRYGVDAIMVGRATFGRPWIFKEIRDYLDAPSSPAALSPSAAPSSSAPSSSPAAISSSSVSSSSLAPSSSSAALSSSSAPSSSPVRCAAPLAQPLPPAPLTFDQKLDILIEQLRINVERIDEYRGILHTRRHLAATPIFKGIPDFRQTRIAMLRAETMADLLAILEDCRHRLSDREVL